MLTILKLIIFRGHCCNQNVSIVYHSSHIKITPRKYNKITVNHDHHNQFLFINSIQLNIHVFVFCELSVYGYSNALTKK